MDCKKISNIFVYFLFIMSAGSSSPLGLHLLNCMTAWTVKGPMRNIYWDQMI